LHVCNHHLRVTFEDFREERNNNQIRLGLLNWESVNNDTIILMPPLAYLIEVVIRLHNRLKVLIEDQAYRHRLYELYARQYEFNEEKE
jgi:hypothetical protein